MGNSPDIHNSHKTTRTYQITSFTTNLMMGNSPDIHNYAISITISKNQLVTNFVRDREKMTFLAY